MDTVQLLGKAYRPRVIDASLGQALTTAGAVVIEGARATGKTMTALHAASSSVFIDDSTVQNVLSIAPQSVIQGQAPRLLDEWQAAPELWNMVRRSVDASTEPGRFILTGSAVAADDVTRHTGAGRFLRLHERTMTWYEKNGASSSPAETVSLSGLFEGQRPISRLNAGPELDDVIENILRSGFPAMATLSVDRSATLLRAYVDEVSRADVHRLGQVRHEPEVIKQLITALARSIASPVTHKTLATDLRVLAPTINAETISTYLGLLRRLFIIEPQRPWTPMLRSRARLRMSPKLHLVDAALAAAMLGAGVGQLRKDLETLGTFFESSVVHDLTVFASALEGDVTHYRDSNGKEIDAIITLPDGRWAAVEVKLGGSQAAAGIASLTDVISQIDTDVIGEPTFRLVVTGTGPILTVDDSTITCPLSSLAP